MAATLSTLAYLVAAVLFIPYLGDRMLPDAHAAASKSSLRDRLLSPFSRLREKVRGARMRAPSTQETRPSPQPSPASGRGGPSTTELDSEAALTRSPSARRPLPAGGERRRRTAPAP